LQKEQRQRTIRHSQYRNCTTFGYQLYISPLRSPSTTDAQQNRLLLEVMLLYTKSHQERNPNLMRILSYPLVRFSMMDKKTVQNWIDSNVFLKMCFGRVNNPDLIVKSIQTVVQWLLPCKALEGHVIYLVTKNNRNS